MEMKKVWYVAGEVFYEGSDFGKKLFMKYSDAVMYGMELLEDDKYMDQVSVEEMEVG